MSIDLESQKQLLNAYKHTYAAKKGLSNPEKCILEQLMKLKIY